MTATTQKRLLAVGAIALALGILSYVAFGGIEKNLVYYWTPQELLARGQGAIGATVRLGGVVQKDSIHWDPATLHLDFRVAMTPEGGDAVSVNSTGAPPQMFQEGIGAVVEGEYDGTVFKADRVMVKHSNEYRAPTTGEKPAQAYKTLLTDD